MRILGPSFGEIHVKQNCAMEKLGWTCKNIGVVWGQRSILIIIK